MLNYADHHRAIESAIRQLLTDGRRNFSKAEIEEVGEFLDAKEYGLALETLSAILLETPDDLDESLVAAIQSLADCMGLFNVNSINSVVAAYERQNLRLAM